MKKLLCAGAALALSAALAAPAAAQVNGVGVTDPAIVVASSTALQAAYQQIGTTFTAQRTQLDQQQQQLSTLLRPFDTNGDGQLDDSERATLQGNASVSQQAQTLEQTISQTQQPIIAARVYAIEQIAQQLNPAVQSVVSSKGVSIILSPQAVVYVSEAVDLTDEIVAALNQAVPAVSTAVPQGWQPQRSSVDLYQQVQQLLLASAVQQAQAQAAQQPAPAAQQGR
jgi:Skp family chaperone for outer membrane proteins